MAFKKITEETSHYNHLEKMTVAEILSNINKEDKTVPFAVEKALPQIEQLVIAATTKLIDGGRLFYIGAGTSGRLGMVDASECPPTFGVPKTLVNAIIAGGYDAITKAVEHAEDDKEKGWKDLQRLNISKKDFVIGIAASGTTPYVIAALRECRNNSITTGCITCNPQAPIIFEADYPIEVTVGPEFVTGSTRMKSGTAQKLILNMISTSIMIQMGQVEGNKMVNMQLTNNKLVDRGIKMIMESTGISNYEEAEKLLKKQGSVKKALEAFHS